VPEANRVLPDGEYPPLQGPALYLMTIAVASATFMEVLDLTIVNVSIPSIAGSLGVSPSEGTWAISSYTLATAIMQPLAGWIGRRFGEVRTFVTSITLFMLFSALCGLATSMPMLVTCRVIQGLVSGPMMAMAQATLLRNYPLHKRGTALAIWSMVIVVAPIVGPLIGGWITDRYSWPWIFYINIPVGAFGATMIWSTLRRRESKRVRSPIDAVGLTLLVIGVGSLQFMLDNGNEKDWFSSPIIIASAVIAVVSLTFLIPWELTDKHPVVDLSLFKRRNFRVGALTLAIAYFGFMAVNVLFPLWLQTAAGYTATWAGYAIAPVGIMTLIIAPFVGRNIGRINLRIAASVSFMIFGINTLWLSGFNEQASFSQMLLPRFWQGFGIAFFFLPLNQILMSDIRPHEIASAAGLSNFLRTIASSMSTAINIWIWNVRTDYHHAILTENIREGSPGWAKYQAGLENVGIAGVRAFKYVDAVITQQALTLAASDVFYYVGWLFLCLVPAIWLARPPFKSRGATDHAVEH
jgi:DHA2 family multidrug resistance protein